MLPIILAAKFLDATSVCLFVCLFVCAFSCSQEKKAEKKTKKKERVNNKSDRSSCECATQSAQTHPASGIWTALKG